MTGVILLGSIVLRSLN